MNEAMKNAWLEISQMLGGQATQDDLTVFLRTWTWAIKAEREECAKVCDHMAARCSDIRAAALESAAENIRARGQA